MAIKMHAWERHLSFFIRIFFLIILSACKPKESAGRPFPDLTEWDLLIISDSSNWGVGEYYAKLIEADMNVKVNLHDCWVGDMSIGLALKGLQNDISLKPYLGTKNCQSPWSDHAWSDLIKEAEVMILAGSTEYSKSPDGSWDVPEVFFSCLNGEYVGKKNQPGFDEYKANMRKSCVPETFATYKAHLGDFLDEIDKIREGRPLILRMTNYYIPYHSSWSQHGVDEVCTPCIKNLLDVIQQVADEHGVPVANTLVGFNGENLLTDPVALGYIGYDGEHLSDVGAQYVASILRQTGYEYAGK
jgi:hypothetical protein